MPGGAVAEAAGLWVYSWLWTELSAARRGRSGCFTQLLGFVWSLV